MIDRRLIFAIGWLVVILSVSSVDAHPGHGSHPATEVEHYLLEAPHIGPVVIVCFVAITVGLFFARRLTKNRASV